MEIIGSPGQKAKGSESAEGGAYLHALGGHQGETYPANVAKVQWFPSRSDTVKSRDG